VPEAEPDIGPARRERDRDVAAYALPAGYKRDAILELHKG
jgi:hypothetical protein